MMNKNWKRNLIEKLTLVYKTGIGETGFKEVKNQCKGDNEDSREVVHPRVRVFMLLHLIQMSNSSIFLCNVLNFLTSYSITLSLGQYYDSTPSKPYQMFLYHMLMVLGHIFLFSVCLTEYMYSEPLRILNTLCVISDNKCGLCSKKLMILGLIN